MDKKVILPSPMEDLTKSIVDCLGLAETKNTKKPENSQSKKKEVAKK